MEKQIERERSLELNYSNCGALLTARCGAPPVAMIISQSRVP